MTAQTQRLYGATGWTLAVTDAHERTLFLQLRTGQVASGNVWYSRLWGELEAGSDLDTAITTIARDHRAAPEQLRDDIAADLGDFIRAGIFTPRRPSPPPRWLKAIIQRPPSDDTPRQRREPVDAARRAPRWVAVTGAVAIVLMLCLRLLPFWLLLRLLVAVRRARPRQASLEEARQVAASVKRMARWLPFRQWCAEQSPASFLAGVCLGAPPVWCYGVRLVPGSDDGLVLNPDWPVHAWLEAGGRALDYADQDATFIPLIRV